MSDNVYRVTGGFDVPTLSSEKIFSLEKAQPALGTVKSGGAGAYSQGFTSYRQVDKKSQLNFQYEYVAYESRESSRRTCRSHPLRV